MICPICRQRADGGLVVISFGRLSQLACRPCARRLQDVPFCEEDYEATRRGLVNVLLDIVDGSAVVCPSVASVQAHREIAEALRGLLPVRTQDELQNVFAFVPPAERRRA